MANLVRDNKSFIFRRLVLERVDDAVFALKETVDAWPKCGARFKIADFKVILLQCRGSKSTGAPIAIRFGRGLLVGLLSLTANVDPGVHVSPLQANGVFLRLLARRSFG